MYIQPQSIFKMLKGVPFNSNKKHTIWFRSAQEQYTYFNSKSVKTFTDFTYVKQNGVVRVPAVADTIYDCNYCMFKNVGFGDKWFYGYITDIEYVNNEVSHVSIEIDYLQTWLFDISIGKCFVEREHVADDSIGLHTVVEPIGFGEQVCLASNSYYFTDWDIIFQLAPNSLSDTVGEASGTIIEGQYTGCKLVTKALTSDDIADEVNALINNFIIEGYNIVSMYMCPRLFTDFNGGIAINVGTDSVGERPTSFVYHTDSYTPINNKLFTSPYTFLRVSNNQGTIQDYKWEDFFGNGTAGFAIKHCFVNGVVCDLRPTAYQVFNDSPRLQSIPISKFPTVQWNENAFLHGIRNSIEGAPNHITGIVNSVSNFIDKGIDFFGDGENISNSPYSTISDIFPTGMLSPKQVKGASTEPNVDLKEGTFGYNFYVMGIRPEYARIVDEFLTRFGYAVNRYKIPELTSRSSFNYVKTKEANITGNAPNEALENISTIFNSGITLWHNTNVRNYNTDNSIVEGGE